jgi:hypothetical protein
LPKIECWGEVLEEREMNDQKIGCIIIMILVGMFSFLVLLAAMCCLSSSPELVELVRRLTEKLPIPPDTFVAVFVVLGMVLVGGPLVLLFGFLFHRIGQRVLATPLPVNLSRGDPVKRSWRKGIAQLLIGPAIWVMGACLSWTLIRHLTVDEELGRLLAGGVCLFVVFPIGGFILAEGFSRLQALDTGELSLTGATITNLCPSCHTKLGGAEYRHAMRFGYAICPRCGTRVEGFESYDHPASSAPS